MKQVGRILKLDGEFADVEVQRHTACKKCGGCQLGTEKANIVKAKNTINAKEGQKVYLDLANISVLKAAAIMYIIPLIALVLGFMFSYYGAQQFGYVETKELWGIFFGLAFMVGSFMIIHKFEPKFNLSTLYGPKIIELAHDIEEE